tara:strand:+ start:311 stop:634 length:324 start_codon:yes stop_codon:yes gene_type:complete
MQTEFIQSMGSLFAFLFIAGIAYTAWTTQSPTTFDDNFVIGYVEKSDPVVVTQAVASSPVNLQLQKDCAETLVKLGFRKREAKQKVKELFYSGNAPTSIQECLRKIL